MTAEATGTCLCGAVRFTATGIDPHIHACHCTMCRTWSGGPGMAVNVGSVEFESEEAISRYASSDWAERGFCSRCGSNLFYHLKEPGQMMMWAGTFTDASAFKLDGEIYIDEKPPGYDFAGDHSRLTAAEFLASMGAPEN